MPTVRLRIDLAYDGSPYLGFARQKDGPSVQAEVEQALSIVLNVPEVEVSGAGRTDRGVHAEAQTVHVDVPSNWKRLADLPGLARSLDKMVGRYVTIRRIRVVPSSFDARFSATGRRYRYRICDAVSMLPLWHNDTWHRPGPLDVAAMEAAAQALVGEHDYTSFCRKRLVRLKDGRVVEGTMMRRIDRLTVRRSRPDHLILIRVEGKAFCHQMVRAITGSLVEVGAGKRPPGWIAELLAARDRTDAGAVAPASGLSLVGISYAADRSGGGRNAEA